MQKTKDYLPFRQFIQNAQLNTRNTQQAHFLSFLILPVQRVPRYALLLEAVIKYTPANHPDYHNLVEAKTKIREILITVNKNVEEEEERLKIMEIQSRFVTSQLGLASKAKNIVEPHRRYIYDSVLTVENLPLLKRLHCYLFNDIFVTARIFLQSFELQEIHRTFPLECTWVVDDNSVVNYPALQTPELMSGVVFQVISTDFQYVFKCKNNEEKNNWTKLFQEKIMSFVHSKERNKQIRANLILEVKNGVWRVVDKSCVNTNHLSIDLQTVDNSSFILITNDLTSSAPELSTSDLDAEFARSPPPIYRERKPTITENLMDKSVKIFKPLFIKAKGSPIQPSLSDSNLSIPVTNSNFSVHFNIGRLLFW